MTHDTTTKPLLKPRKVTLVPMSVLTVTDTAMTAADIGPILSKNYGELFSFISSQKLQSGKIMAFYYSSHQPFIMDAAVEVNEIPATLTGRIKGRIIKGGDAIVVHYQGPYDQVGVAYTAITNWLNENNKTATRPPFEVYLNDPYTIRNPALLLTDVYQPLN